MPNAKTDLFVNHAIAIAKDDSHGYSQYSRWGKDYDCSSLMYECGYKAGYSLPRSGTRYTGTMIAHFSACGFRVDAFDGNLNDLERGDILLNTAHHTAVYIGNGQIVEASISETGGISGKVGDQTGHEIHIRSVYNYPWTHVLTPPKEQAAQHSASSKQTTQKAVTIPNSIKSIKIEDAITRVAIEVINGKYGNGSSRKDNIYKVVQKRVNELVNGKA